MGATGETERASRPRRSGGGSRSSPRVSFVAVIRKALIPLLIALGATACAQTFNAGAASVNGVKISLEALDQRLEASQAQQPGAAEDGLLERQRQQLAGLIQEEILRQEAARRGIAATDDDIEQQLDQLRAGRSEEEFLEQVRLAGLTLEQVREQLGLRIVVQRIQEDLAPEVDEAEVRQVYDASLEQFRQVKVRHILFTPDEEVSDEAARREARSTLVELRAGRSFAALARERSDDTGSARNGGRLGGWTPLAQFDPSFAQAAGTAGIGKVTDPVRSQFGWHLLIVDARRVQPYAQVRDQLQGQLTQDAADRAFTELLQSLASTARVSVNPLYGDWDPEQGAIIPHTFVEPPDVGTDPDVPGQSPVPIPGIEE